MRPRGRPGRRRLLTFALWVIAAFLALALLIAWAQ
jgi:hypothetical protein